jgi:hypothetical protein
MIPTLAAYYCRGFPSRLIAGLDLRVVNTVHTAGLAWGERWVTLAQEEIRIRSEPPSWTADR